jgi:hypothetical protein
VYIITAWDEMSEHTVRSRDPQVITQKAKDLVRQGMRITITRTTTGESLTVSELESEIAHAQGS